MCQLHKTIFLLKPWIVFNHKSQHVHIILPIKKKEYAEP